MDSLKNNAKLEKLQSRKLNKKVGFFSAIFVLLVACFSFLIGVSYSAFNSKATSTGNLTFAVTGSPSYGTNFNFSVGNSPNSTYIGDNKELEITGNANLLKVINSQSAVIKIDFDFNSTYITYAGGQTISSSDGINFTPSQSGTVFTFISASNVGAGEYVALDKILANFYATQAISETTYTITATASSNASASSTAKFTGNYCAEQRGFIVTFEYNGAVTQSMPSGAYESIDALPTPTRANATFKGWFSDEACLAYTKTSDSVLVGNGGDSYTPTKDITLYAGWLLNGVGTEIYSAYELFQLAASVNSGSSYHYSGTTFTQQRNIDLSGIANWAPIGGASSCAFKGNYNGNNYNITNLTITSTSSNRAGLFGTIAGNPTTSIPSIISNINLSCSINTSTQYVGGIVAFISSYGSGYSGYIENCTVGKVGDCVISSSKSNALVGGILGYLDGQADLYEDYDGVINCSVACWDYDVEITSTYYVGAVVGCMVVGDLSCKVLTSGTGKLTLTGSTYGGGVVGYVQYFYAPTSYVQDEYHVVVGVEGEEDRLTINATNIGALFGYMRGDLSSIQYLNNYDDTIFPDYGKVGSGLPTRPSFGGVD